MSKNWLTKLNIVRQHLHVLNLLYSGVNRVCDYIGEIWSLYLILFCISNWFPPILQMMTIHGSFHNNKQLFSQAVSFAAVLSFIPIVVAIFLLIKNGASVDAIVTRNFYSSQPLRIEMCATLLVLCCLINFPLSQMIEQWLGRRDVSKLLKSILTFSMRVNI